MKHISICEVDTDPAKLSELFEPAAPRQPWRPEELGAVFKHQMHTPIQFDLAGQDPVFRDRLRLLAASEGLLLQSFHDLFCHPHPPLHLLEIVKDFAKRLAADPHSPIPRDIARVLYYLSIATAQWRLQRRISALDTGRLARGLRWALAQPWLDRDAHEILAQALALIEKQEEVRHE